MQLPPGLLSDSLPRPQAAPIIEVSHVWAGYDQDPVLEDVSLTVRKGDFIGLIGPNGGGKNHLFQNSAGASGSVAGPCSGHGRPGAAGATLHGLCAPASGVRSHLPYYSHLAPVANETVVTDEYTAIAETFEKTGVVISEFK